MSAALEYRSNQAGVAEIAAHLSRCDTGFVPPLSDRVQLDEYARKLADRALRLEAWADGTLVGLVAVYCNTRNTGLAFLTNVSVVSEWRGQGIATHLIGQCIDHIKALGMGRIHLEVGSNNASAIRLYEQCGFIADQADPPLVRMSLDLQLG